MNSSLLYNDSDLIMKNPWASAICFSSNPIWISLEEQGNGEVLFSLYGFFACINSMNFSLKTQQFDKGF